VRPAQFAERCRDRRGRLSPPLCGPDPRAVLRLAAGGAGRGGAHRRVHALRRLLAHHAAAGHAGARGVRDDDGHPLLARGVDPAHRGESPGGHDLTGDPGRAGLRLLRLLHAHDGHLPARPGADPAAGAAAAEIRGARLDRRSAQGMKFGLIGYGLWGRYHARAIVKAPGAELTAIACRTEDTAAAAARDFAGVAVHRDYRELLARADVDVVDVVVPNALHAEMGVAALEAGKDVLLEKPLAPTREDCDRLIAAGRR